MKAASFKLGSGNVSSRPGGSTHLWGRWPNILIVRYYVSMLSIAAVDFGFAIIFHSPLEQVLSSAVILVGINLIGARLLFGPVHGYLKAPERRPAPVERIATLPQICTAWAAVLVFIQVAFKYHIVPSLLGAEVHHDLGKIELLIIPLFYWLFFTALIYFVMTDYAALLRNDLFRRLGQLVPAGRGRVTYRLLIGFCLTSVLPSSLLMLHAVQHGGLEIQRIVLRDLSATGLAVGVAVFFIARSLLRPLRALEDAIERVGTGNVGATAPVLSNDEAGRLTAGFNRMIEALQERAFIRETFGKFVPEKVAAAILAGHGTLEPANAPATILYADIEDFTSIAERISPRRVVQMLNEYFSAVIGPVTRHGGVVNQFQGDAMLVTFNVPVPDSQHADAAMAAALEMLRVTRVRRFAGIDLRIRIGISTGEVVAGSVGSDDRLIYTVHGDAVNVAARLEQLNKELGTRVLISGETLSVLRGTYPIEPAGEFQLRGKARPVMVSKVCEDSGEPKEVLQKG